MRLRGGYPNGIEACSKAEYYSSEAVNDAQGYGLPKEYIARLRKLVLRNPLDDLRRALTGGERPADFETVMVQCS